LRAGADKVSLNTAAIKNPIIIKEAAHRFGSSTIVVAIEAIKQPDGRYLAYTDNAREYTGIDVFEWAQEVEELGAGEIVLTSVDREGTGQGYDIDLTRKVSDMVNIPVIAHGGAGSPEHINSVINDGGADAVAVASILHYGLASNPDKRFITDLEGNTEFLNSGKSFNKINPSSLNEIKSAMAKSQIPTRHIA
jgi:cyclase